MQSDAAYQADLGVIGGGPAGLMAAEQALDAGVRVSLYDGMPSLGRKFLMAGKSGLNITHSEPYATFKTHYKNDLAALQPHLDAFGPSDVTQWCETLGVPVFTGSSGRVFPTCMKASPLLRAWLNRLRDKGLSIHTRHRLIDWSHGSTHHAVFETPDGQVEATHKALVLALGGKSWPRLGSTGAWSSLFKDDPDRLAPFRPSNCGLMVAWSPRLRERFSGAPIKSIALSFNNQAFDNQKTRGDCILSAYGLEGSAIYPLSNSMARQVEETKAPAILTMDLMPDVTLDTLTKRLSRPRGKQSRPNHLRKTTRLTGVKAALLHEFSEPDLFDNPERLAARIKALPIPITGPRPIAEAISVSGGVRFDALTDDLMVRTRPGVFCAGEMLDWDAPTGGYLLTACLATGRSAGLGAVHWLHQSQGTNVDTAPSKDLS